MLALWVLLASTGCHRTPAEQAIRETVAAMQKAGNDHDTDQLIEPLSDHFIGTDDESGDNLNRRDFARYVQLILLREQSIHANLGPITIALQGADGASASFTAVFTGGAGLLPDDGQVEHIRTGWRLEGSTWKLVSAEWKQGASDK